VFCVCGESRIRRSVFAVGAPMATAGEYAGHSVLAFCGVAYW
jgi:hypothetical protein